MEKTLNNLKQLGLSHAVPLANKIGPIAAESKLSAFLVGGIVRDALLNRPSKDFDICVAGDYEQMSKLGEYVYSQLSDRDKNKYEMIVRNADRGVNLREFLKDCGGGILLTFLLYLQGKTDIAPVIYPRFLVGMVKIDGEDIELVATRSEDYSETEGVGSRERNPGAVSVASEYEDAIRRDFTVNALYVNLSTGELLDPTNKGLDDLKNKTIRVTRHDQPEKVFLEDPLRILRAIRQSAQLGFTIEPTTQRTIKKLVENKGENFFGRGGMVSAERIRDELSKILVNRVPSQGVNGLLDFGVLDIIMPEVSALFHTPRLNHKDLWYHTMVVLDKINIIPEIEEVINRTAPKVNMDPNELKAKTLLRLRLSALLHDIGKILTRTYEDIICEYCGKNVDLVDFDSIVCQSCGKEVDPDSIEGPSFHDHHKFSEELSIDILRRLAFDTQMIRWVSRDCALHHVDFGNITEQDIETTDQSRPAKRTSVERVVDNLAEVRQGHDDPMAELNFIVRIYGVIRSDASSKTDPLSQQRRAEHFIEQYENIQRSRDKEKEWMEFNKPILSGDEIKEMFGVRPGKWIGDIHRRLKEYKLDNPDDYTVEKAIEIAGKELNKWGDEIYNKEKGD